jgi:hypothetical protein
MENIAAKRILPSSQCGFPFRRRAEVSRSEGEGILNGHHGRQEGDRRIAAICSDTWGVEVRPNETTEVNQPWHWVVIPAMG